jgi:hypothetical protein
MLVTSALVLPISAVMLVGATSASAAKSSIPTGTITCAKVKGTITFTPPEKTGGTAIETSTIVKVTVSKCKKVTATIIPKSGTVNVNIASGTGTNNCASLVGVQNTSQTLKVTWSPSADGSSQSTYSNYTSVVSGGKEGFELPATGGTGSTTGSYAEGSGSKAEAISNKTAGQINAECGGSGLSVLDIKKGSTTL